jgi:coproporphyrinogen III oxidase
MSEPANVASVASYLEQLHRHIVANLELLDSKPFALDRWQKPSDAPLGGQGVTSILEEGSLFERAGVGFSRVTGAKLPASASASRPGLAGRSFEAIGVSLVLHPRNPYVPTVHMNVRFFVASKPGEEDIWWFGGGMDLTPYYGFEEDTVHFHRTCKEALEPFGPTRYSDFKARCDEYFFIRHRSEPRGVGGVFFDDLSEPDFESAFALQRSVGDAFLKAYVPIVERRRDVPFGESQRLWQAMRRGRYVEFNLVYDRGTLFGLQSGGRVESILMSMPPLVTWRYDFEPTPNSPEDNLMKEFLVVRPWT